MKQKQKNMDMNKKDKRKKKKKKGVFVKILLIILIIIVCFAIYLTYKTIKNGGGIKGLAATVVGHNAETLKNLDKLNFLLLGDNQGLTDSIMVCSYDPKTQKAAILSIPRDTFIGKNKNKATAASKINSLYQGDNPEKVMEEVSDLVGIDLKYYIVVDTDALIELVDATGGITFNVPINMDYDDKVQDLHIHLKAGEQLIDGDKAEQLLRFRHNNNGTSYPEEYGDNDYGRMRTQREFIMQAVSQMLKVSNVFKINEFIDIIKENVNTNMDFNLIKDYIPYVVDFSTENLQTGALPGASEKCNGVWLFIHDEDEAKKLIDEMFFDKVAEEETSEDENIIANEI